MQIAADRAPEVWGQPSPVPAGTSPASVTAGAPRRIEPNYVPSGALAAETNTVRGVVLKYSEPPEAKKPTKKWRLHVFKGNQQLGMVDARACSRLCVVSC